MTKIQKAFAQLKALDLLTKEIKGWEKFYENELTKKRKELLNPEETTNAEDIEETEIKLETVQTVIKLIEKEFLK